MDPTFAGLIDHVTAVVDAFVTDAVNVWLWPTNRVFVAGDTVTETGESVTDALAEIDAFA
jgi:hypothetical protein